MFTGIVQAVGRVSRIEGDGPARRVVFDCGALEPGDLRVGESMCVNGVCLTLVQRAGRNISADVSAETLSCTTIGRLEAGSPLNLERSLAAGDRIGGHFVSGHVDGVGRIVAMQAAGPSTRVEIEAPAALGRFLARKGSVCVDGVSLTINDSAGGRFGVHVIPHTLEQTIFHTYRTGSEVNLEVDLMARYLDQLLRSRQD